MKTKKALNKYIVTIYFRNENVHCVIYATKLINNNNNNNNNNDEMVEKKKEKQKKKTQSKCLNQL